MSGSVGWPLPGSSTETSRPPAGRAATPTEIYLQAPLATGQSVVLPLAASLGGLGVAVLVGVVAGVHPAARAARLPPTEALRSAV